MSGLLSRQEKRQSRLEIHIPISPTDFFFNRIHYLAASLRLNGGALADSKIVVTIGDRAEPFDPGERLRWNKSYNIEWRWMPSDLFEQYSYFATRLYRYRHAFQSDAVLMLDADVIVAAPFDDLIERVLREQKVIGVPANFSPVARTDRDFTWEKLFEAAGLGEVPYVMEHSGFGIIYHTPNCDRSPPYYNFGVLPMPATIARQIGETIFDELKIVAGIEDFFMGQMSTTLAIVRNRIPWGTASFKYNFVNNDLYLQRYRDEFGDLRLLHFLDNQNIHKDISFESMETVETMLNGIYDHEVDKRFIQILRPVHERVKKDAEEAAKG